MERRVRTQAKIYAAIILLACRPCAIALNPSLEINQYAHKAWTVSEGFLKGTINAIAQTPDGYLWLGTEFGLLRFDGVRIVPLQLPDGEQPPSNHILKLLAARDGTLWIGTRKGLASWKSGKLTQYPELVGHLIPALVEDRAGTVWASVGSLPAPGKLCAIQKGSVQCYAEDGALGPLVVGLFEDSKGNLWVGVATGLWRWKPGPPKFYPLPGEPNGIQGLAEGDDGALLISTRNGVRRFVDGKTEFVYPLPGSVRQFQALRLLRDRDGGLWIGTFGRGLVHVHQGRADTFAQSDGLSGNDASNSLFEDREGNIWVATSNGLDRFRDLAVATFSVSQGISNPTGPVLAGPDGSIWLDTFDGLTRWNDGQITIYRERGVKAEHGARKIIGSGLPVHGLMSLFQDNRRRIWVSTSGGVGCLENDRFISISGIPGGEVPAIAQDAGGNLWIANKYLGLSQLLPGNVVQQIPWSRLGRKDFATSLAADPFRGGLWLGFDQSGIVYFAEGQLRETYAAAGGMGEGRVNDLRLDRDGTLWAATEGGLSRLQNGRVATLTSKSGLPCDSVHWVMEDDARSLWLNMPCGLVRIARPELLAWATNPTHIIKAAIFDNSDGMRSQARAFGLSPLVARSPDGRLWFSALGGLSVIDPRHIPVNNLRPPVHIEEITADRKSYLKNITAVAASHLRLPPLVRDLQIDYTALSLVAPEKIRFRVKLEGRDPDWQDVGNRRQAFYADLPPRHYRFRVMACNNSGVWNEAGDSLEFSIDPAYYQTNWFKAACGSALLALLWGLYRYRVHQIAREFNAQLEGRVDERLRVARELHDTLLQSVQGMMLQLGAARNMFAKRPTEALKVLDVALDLADKAIVEGREAIQGMRSSTEVTNDLAQAIRALGDELASEGSAELRVQVEGSSRDVHPILRDEVYGIAREAIRNAFRHAQAKVIEAEITYGDSLRLRIRDDGKGIDPAILNEGRTSHYGLPGMRERAARIGGELNVWSRPGAGTEIELKIPGTKAYGTSGAGHLTALFRRGKGKSRPTASGHG